MFTAFTAACIASVALATSVNLTSALANSSENELDHKMYDSTALIEQNNENESVRRKVTCLTARHPDDPCYFRSKVYMKKPRTKKLIDLWSKILPNSSVVEKPADFMWAEFPQMFTQSSIGAFCNVSDTIQPNRMKVSHT